jgi:hypothetical protein
MRRPSNCSAQVHAAELRRRRDAGATTPTGRCGRDSAGTNAGSRPKRLMAMIEMTTTGMTDHETIRFQVKPNPFLYALEASRIHLLVMLALVAVLVPVLHVLPVFYAKKGLPIGFIAEVVLILYGIFGSFFFVRDPCGSLPDIPDSQPKSRRAPLFDGKNKRQDLRFAVGNSNDRDPYQQWTAWECFLEG